MTTNPPEALPASYSYGRVVARFIKAVGDSVNDVDDDTEAVAASGTVTFAPTETDRLISDLTAEPSTHVSHESITAQLDSEGYLSRNGKRWLKLWTGEWRVTFQIPGFTRDAFPILITIDHTAESPLDLLLAQPYEPPSGATVTTLLVPANPLPNSTLTLDPETEKLVWTPLSHISAPSAYDVAVTNGFVGSETEWLLSLIGPKGDTSTVPGPSAYSVAVMNGFVGSETEWLLSLIGPKGDASTVPGPSAYSVAVTNGFVGSEAEWLLSLTGPKGDASTVPGPSAYSVAVANGFVGSEAEWLLSLVGPKGDASAVPGPSAYSVAVANGFVGSEAEWLLSLTGPRGQGITSIADPDLDGVATVTYTDATTSTLPLPRGDVGPANSLTVGTVDTLAAGAPATASFTGTAPAQTLHLGIPQGPAGSPTAFELRGTGMPNGVITASPGTYYTDISGTCGAWRWLKTSGTGNTGWTVVFGNTGWRLVTTALNADTAVESLALKRTSDRVSLLLKLRSNLAEAGKICDPLPDGFRPMVHGLSASWRPCAPLGRGLNPATWVMFAGASEAWGPPYLACTGTGGSSNRAEGDWATPDQWPTTLPGTPA